MSINSVTVVGRVGRDPEVRYTASKTPCCNFSIATSEKWKDKQGERQEKTTWHRISLFGPQAEVAGEHIKKGDLIGITGKLDNRKWTDKEGNERETTEIIGREINFFGVRGNQDEGGGGKRQGYNGGKTQGSSDRNDQAFSDDDIPF